MEATWMERKGAGTAFTGCYRDSDVASDRRGRSRADVLQSELEEQKVRAGSWHDATRGDISFKDYVDHECRARQRQRPHGR